MRVASLSVVIFSIVLTSVKKSTCSCQNVKKEVKCELVSSITSALISEIPGINEVTKVQINRNPALSISRQAFQSAANLQRAIIMYNKIDKIYSNTFENIPVKYIHLGYNGINLIYPGAFFNLPQLETLRLNNNNLKQISKGIFQNLTLADLTLSHNKIVNIEDMALENLGNLKKLKLDNNELQTIFVHRIITYPERLEILWLHNNSLKTISNYMLQGMTNLKTLNLGFNSISMIEPKSFEQTPKLNYLVLTHNHLKEVDGNIFPRTGMDYLEVLYLDNNKLMFLSTNFFFPLEGLKKITIIGNPWFCQCLNEIQRLLAQNNIEDKCNEEYTSGKRPICVSDKVGSTECVYRYNNNLSEKYETFKRDNPVFRSTISCIL